MGARPHRRARDGRIQLRAHLRLSLLLQLLGGERPPVALKFARVVERVVVLPLRRVHQHIVSLLQSQELVALLATVAIRVVDERHPLVRALHVLLLTVDLETEHRIEVKVVHVHVSSERQWLEGQPATSVSYISQGFTLYVRKTAISPPPWSARAARANCATQTAGSPDSVHTYPVLFRAGRGALTRTHRHANMAVSRISRISPPNW